MIAAPYLHENASISRTMGLVMLALFPATVLGLYQFGWPAILLFTTTVLAAIVAEYFCLKVAGKIAKPFLLDGSAILTGWLLAMTLPPWAPWWIGILGAFLAIVVGKHVFGGLGQNLFNPAMVARVALLISFPFEMTLFTQPNPFFSVYNLSFNDSLDIFLGYPIPDAFTSATVLDFYKAELSQGISALQIKTDSLTQLLWGNTSGSLGETSALLIVLGGLFLIYKRVITWHIPVAMLGTLTLLASVLFWFDPNSYMSPVTHLLSGAVLLGAFFIATDLVTSPVSTRGQLIFGAGCGLLVLVIRTFGNYPEGVAFAVLLMNGFTPLIDHYFKPRIYGRDRKGQPLSNEP